MQHISKHRIVPGFNKRDKMATRWVYEYYRTPVYVIVKKITRDSPETADLVAKTFLTLLDHNIPFESQRKLEYFLYATARNISMDYLRHHQTIKDKSDEVAGYYLSIEEEDIKAAELSAAFHHLIQLGINILPARCKEVFLLCYIEQMKNAEIASRLGITEKTVANLKINAYKKLRKEIDITNGSSLMDLLGMLLL